MLFLAMLSALHHDAFVQPFEPINNVRLQLTPTLDGKLDKEEWDAIAPNLYLQWEPGKVHVAGELPKGKQIVVSLDLKGDGWLVGNDNYQLRLWSDEGGAKAAVDQLDAKNRKGPEWIQRGEMTNAVSAISAPGTDSDVVEGTFRDVGFGLLPRKNSDMWMRVDVLDLEESLPANDPRILSKVRFDTQRAIALPDALKWGIQSKTRAVVEKEAIKLRYNFEGGDKLGVKTIAMRTEGSAEDATNQMKLLFPNFDSKGRTYVDYVTAVDNDVNTGYKIARAQLGFVDGPDAVIQVSYRIAPIMEFYIVDPVVKMNDKNKDVELTYIYQMYTKQNSAGQIKVEAPDGWEVLKNGNVNFNALGNQSADSRVLRLRVPAGVKGTFPIKFSGSVKDQTVGQICYVTIQ